MTPPHPIGKVPGAGIILVIIEPGKEGLVANCMRSWEWGALFSVDT